MDCEWNIGCSQPTISVAVLDSIGNRRGLHPAGEKRRLFSSLRDCADHCF
jgi:hypothetical protein